MGLAVQRQDERHGVLGDGMGRIGRHARHGDAQTLGARDVDVVEARRAEGYQANAGLGERCKASSVQLIVDKGADGVRIAGQGRRACRELCVEIGDRMRRGQIGLVEVAPIVSLGAEHGDTHELVPGTGFARAAAAGLRARPQK
jgi:hypothetical protein